VLTNKRLLTEMKSPPQSRRRAFECSGCAVEKLALKCLQRLALGFGGLFLFGLFFLLFRLVLVADEFQNGHLGVVADSIARLDDATVAPREVGKLQPHVGRASPSAGR